MFPGVLLEPEPKGRQKLYGGPKKAARHFGHIIEPGVIAARAALASAIPKLVVKLWRKVTMKLVKRLHSSYMFQSFES